MSEVKVSIIVPVYNAEATLSRCVNSLIMQTLIDIQIILIDDGSKDNSFSLCKSLAEKDRRILAVNKENGGVSSARNIGLKLAMGEYIGFVDADDFVKNDMFERLYNKAKISDSDICICGYNTFNKGDTTPHLLPYSKEIYEKNEIFETFVLPLIGEDYEIKREHIGGFVWRNLYKAGTVKALTFNEKISIMEDTIFNINAYLNANRVTVLNEALINYVYEEGSLTNNYRSDLWNEFYEVLKLKEKAISDDNLSERAYICFYNEVLDCVIFAVKNIKKSDCEFDNKKKLNEFKNILKSDYVLSAKKHLKIKGMPLKKKVLLGLMRLNLYKVIFSLM